MIAKLIRDPLLHFLFIGACLFGVYHLVSGDEVAKDGKTIVVDRDNLLTFIQYRSKAFNPALANQRLDSLSPTERKRLIHDYVREEALYREAQALGMNENDYIIRRRAVQKLEFIARGLAAQTVSLDIDKAHTYFNAHRQDYYEQPSYTFTHVFIKTDSPNSPAAQKRAVDLLQQLNGQQVAFSDAGRFGDRFLYNRNYVERTPDYIASQFGESFKQQLSRLKPDSQHWRGPLKSSHGLHLVMLSAHRPGRVPTFAEVRPRVEEDFRRWQAQQKQELAIQKIVGQYHVEYRL